MAQPLFVVSSLTLIYHLLVILIVRLIAGLANLSSFIRVKIFRS